LDGPQELESVYNISSKPKQMNQSQTLTLVILIIFSSACTKITNLPRGSSRIEIQATIIDTVKANCAFVKSTAVKGENGTITDHGFCWGQNPLPDLTGSRKSLGVLQTSCTFFLKVSELTPTTKYFIRSFIQYDAQTIYGTQNEFITPDFTLPQISTTDVTSITGISAICGGIVTNDGNGTISARGVCWNTIGNPTLNNCTNATRDGIGIGNYTSQVTGLLQLTTYYIVAYATNEEGTIYGNELNFKTLSPSIGETYGGGIIFYIDGTGHHGLIAASSDQSIGALWGCQGTSIPGTSTAIGSGLTNTISIVTVCTTAGITARICNDLVLNGYDDWFLPSKDELNKMYLQKTTIGGFSSGYYWSSSESTDVTAWIQGFNNGNQNAFSKNSYYYVRAIRAF
jgi:hypothetical protein